MRLVAVAMIAMCVMACGSSVIAEFTADDGDNAAVDGGPPPLPTGCADCAAACLLPAECAEGSLMCGRHCADGVAADACPDGTHTMLCADLIDREDCIPVIAPMCSMAPLVFASCCSDDGLAVQECWSDHSCPQPREECLVAFCQTGRCLIEAVPDGYGCEGGACLNGFCGAI